MKAITKTVYFCDHPGCGKHMLSGSRMSVHERGCRYNPDNRHKCFEYCGNLIREFKVNPGEHFGYYVFTCSAKSRLMYSYKAEKRGTQFMKRMAGFDRMPLECFHYNDHTDEILNDRENDENDFDFGYLFE